MSSRNTVLRTVTCEAAALLHFQMPYEPSHTLGCPVGRHRPMRACLLEQYSGPRGWGWMYMSESSTVSDAAPVPFWASAPAPGGRSAKPLKQPSNRLLRTTTVIGTCGGPSPFVLDAVVTDVAGLDVVEVHRVRRAPVPLGS